MKYYGCWSLVVAGKVTDIYTTYSPTRPGLWMRAVYWFQPNEARADWIASEILWVK